MHRRRRASNPGTLNTRFKDIFAGRVVNKRPTFNTGMDEFPRYVLEYLIDNYCEEEISEKDFEFKFPGAWHE